MNRISKNRILFSLIMSKINYHKTLIKDFHIVKIYNKFIKDPS